MIAFTRFMCALAGLAWSVLVVIKAYGLTIESWPWLVWGTIGTGLFMAASGAWSRNE